MSDQEKLTFRTADGDEYCTGLQLPNEEELALMAMVPDFPEAQILDNTYIQRGLSNNYYLESRKIYSPWIVNQNPLGKCNASAAKAGVEQIRNVQGMPHVFLSDCDLYTMMNGGRDNGSALIRAFELLQSRGMSPMELVVDGKKVILPNDFYKRSSLSAAVSAEANKEAARFKGWELFKVPRNADTPRIIGSALAMRLPVVFAWDVISASMNLRNGYVVVGRSKGNHANVFHSGKWVGGQDLVHPDNRNSWGPAKNPLCGKIGGRGWGEDGFGLFTMENAMACMQWHQMYVITSAQLDPKDYFMKKK